MLRPGTMIVVLCLLLGGCGGGSSTDRPAAEGPDLGVPVRLATCTDWKNANVEERLGTIRELQNFASQPVSGLHGAQQKTLDDHQAYELFDHYCANEFARGFELYKLYFRASAFIGQQPQQ